MKRKRPDYELDRDEWIRLNQEKMQIQCNDMDITFIFPSDLSAVPPLNVVINVFPQDELEEVTSVEIKVEFYNVSGIPKKKSPDWSGIWNLTGEFTTENIKSDKILISKIHLHDVSYPWGERDSRDNHAKFFFRINHDDSLIYFSPMTRIKSSRRKEPKLDPVYYLEQNIVGRFRIKIRWNWLHYYFSHDIDDHLGMIPKWMKEKNLPELLAAQDGMGCNPFMTSIFYGKHILAIQTLALVKDMVQRTFIVLTMNYDKSNILHVAASRGNYEFLFQLRGQHEYWGIDLDDIRFLLCQKEIHGATPFDMAYFQHFQRRRDRSDVMILLLIWMYDQDKEEVIGIQHEKISIMVSLILNWLKKSTNSEMIGITKSQVLSVFKCLNNHANLTMRREDPEEFITFEHEQI